MSGDRLEEWVDALRDEYHRPAEPPREEMWTAIEARLGPRETRTRSLAGRRLLRLSMPKPLLAWSAAAAALVVLGVGIGRMTAPEAGTTSVPGAPLAGADGSRASAAPLRVAVLRHLERSEGLITMVHADGRSGRVDPEVGPWATTLLAETRLLLDHAESVDPTMRALLEDLELVLVQIVGTAELGAQDQGRASTEMSLTLDAIERREVVARIQALVPTGPGLAGA
jgi:hypothetical protein